MKTSALVGGMVVCAVGLVLVFGSLGVAQQPGRQPTRQIGGQNNPPGGGGEQQVQINRQPMRRVQGGPGNNEPSIDQQSGQFKIQRQVIRPGWRRLPLRPQSQWRLGVHIDNAPKGLLITDVARNSTAYRFGLEPGDYLLDVMGYPVGFYGDSYYPLAETFNQVVRPDGWANVLIWNKRTNGEEAMWIQLEPAAGDRGAIWHPGAVGQPTCQ